MKKTKIGKCKLCKKTKKLNFEHIPPRSAFNKETKYFSLNQTEYYQNARDYIFNGLKPKSKKEQGGVGYYCFCEECNGFLGSNYVRTYKKFAQRAMDIILLNDENAKGYEFDVSGINLLKFLKQITSMFIGCNDHLFTETYPELLEFVENKSTSEISNRFRFYMYLNIEGQIRNGHIHFTNFYGPICEFTFKPFGFVLNIDNSNRIMELSEITNFKQYNQIKEIKKIPIRLNKLSTYSPLPLDYKSKKEMNYNKE